MPVFSKIHWLKLEDVRQIVLDVGSPIDGDLETLKDQINRAFVLYASAARDEFNARKETTKQLSLFVSRARSLQHAFRPEIARVLRAAVRQELDGLDWQKRVRPLNQILQCPEDHFPINALNLIPLAEETIKILMELGRTVLRLKVSKAAFQNSPLADLVANYLPLLYEDYFGKAFGIGGGSKGRPGGPGMRFVLGCLKAGGIARTNGQSYSPGTIRKYWQEVRAGKSRRKLGKPRESF
jgi:hypothetical protein